MHGLLLRHERAVDLCVWAAADGEMHLPIFPCRKAALAPGVLGALVAAALGGWLAFPSALGHSGAQRWDLGLSTGGLCRAWLRPRGVAAPQLASAPVYSHLLALPQPRFLPPI